MKVLFVTMRALEINSSVTISNIGLLKGLIQLGCEVDLLMPYASKSLVQYDPIEGILDDLNVLRVEGNKIHERLVTGETSKVKSLIVNLLRKSFYKLSLYDNTIRLINKADINLLNNERYDLVISTSDPKTSHIFVDRLIKQGLKYRVWMQHWGDPLSLDITKKTIYPDFYIKAKEKQIFSCADIIVYVSPLTEQAQKKTFPKYKDKMRFVPLPYDKQKIYKTQENKKITIGYFGDYNSKIRNIMPLYDYCGQNTDYNLIIAGSSNLTLEEKDNIRVFPRIRQEQVNELEEQCDILACICNKSGTQIPGKIYYYSATNKPILVILDGEYKNEITEYLSKYNRFIICENNIEDINFKIQESLRENKSYAPCIEFSPPKIASKLLKLFEEKV